MAVKVRGNPAYRSRNLLELIFGFNGLLRSMAAMSSWCRACWSPIAVGVPVQEFSDHLRTGSGGERSRDRNAQPLTIWETHPFGVLRIGEYRVLRMLRLGLRKSPL